MAQRVKALAARPDGLSLTPGPTGWKDKSHVLFSKGLAALGSRSTRAWNHAGTYSTVLWVAETGGCLHFLTTSLVRNPAPRNMTKDIYMM